MRPGAVLLPALLALALGWAGGAVASEPAAAESSPSAVRLLLPGRLADATLVTDGTGRDVLAVVLRSSEDAGDGEAWRRVYLYDPAARTLVPRGGPLAEGAPELVPGAEGRLWVGLSRYGGLDLLPVLDSPPADSAASSVADSAQDSTQDRADGEPTVTLELPRRAERTSWGLRLKSPRAHALPEVTGGADGPPCLATEPEPHGRRRLRVLLLCPGREPEETWALLPGPETVTAARFGVVDGTPALAILTRETVGLFVKLDLRVFPLAGSRSRMGAGPVLEARTDCPMGRGAELELTDADGDGAEDLVVICRTGLLDQELRVEVYRHLAPDEGGAPFERRPRVARIEGGARAWHFGEDWTGDGVPDLAFIREDVLHLHAGETRGRPVQSRATRTLALSEPGTDDEDAPSTSVTIGTSGTNVRLLAGPAGILAAGDLDGDGRPELVLHRSGEGGSELLLLTP